MQIELTKHALKRIGERGITLDEVRKTILNTKCRDEEYKRFSVVKVFEYNQLWEGVFYRQKEVKVIFTFENDKIVVITAISRYFKE